MSDVAFVTVKTGRRQLSCLARGFVSCERPANFDASSPPLHVVAFFICVAVSTTNYANVEVSTISAGTVRWRDKKKSKKCCHFCHRAGTIFDLVSWIRTTPSIVAFNAGASLNVSRGPPVVPPHSPSVPPTSLGYGGALPMPPPPGRLYAPTSTGPISFQSPAILATTTIVPAMGAVSTTLSIQQTIDNEPF